MRMEYAYPAHFRRSSSLLPGAFGSWLIIAYVDPVFPKGDFNVGISLGIDFDDGYFFTAVVIENNIGRS